MWISEAGNALPLKATGTDRFLGYAAELTLVTIAKAMSVNNTRNPKGQQ